MAEAIILSGSGRYRDPWHPFTETSAALAEIVRAAGFTVKVADEPDTALAGLGADVRLVIVNAGDSEGPVPPDVLDSPIPVSERAEPGAIVDSATVAAANDALAAAIDRGIGILAMHTAAASLRDYTAFERALGARWVRDVSWHPPIGDATVHIVGNHVIAEGLDDFSVFDERYTGFRLLDVIEPIAEHEEEGVRHPLIWAREFGRSRLVYDALGHDARSYESAGHRALLARALDWLSRVPALTTGVA
ncbi:ThuA domain-containing protein [Agromyces sp. SYSU K20354]|uniref:ThuA domain-containing protein n=1 Tax=Agromyces cavernae TaxID=2898659 RepID=UPI001E2AF5DE|nr:ThuA domain-containing protein [Agromyces cavernae]MCD2442951.1 ThuA domain-containing protein [Agromyces cavernae]